MNLLGIDIGGTGIKGAPVDLEKGELSADRNRIPTPKPATPEAVAKTVAEVAGSFDTQGAVGITFPAIVQHGLIGSAANVDESWIGIQADDLFSNVLGRPVVVLNDADAAGMAEVRYGAGRNRRGVVILLTLGTGIGSAIFTNGKLLANTEFGHLTIRGKDAEKRASEKARETKDLSWKKWSEHLSEFLNEMEKLFSPDLFIIGGGASKKADKYFDHVKEEIHTEIVAAQLQNEAGIIGAALAASEKE